ncbi:MAG: calcineurin-like phosphoesterase family protein [Prolixibacteraceae bacterium]|nr:calcineurin-like phosphoesterase family protein [Prolixibacteraceae bacterium]
MLKTFSTLLIFLCFMGQSSGQQQHVTARVYHDRNNNLQFDPGETPLEGIAVSTMGTIALTNRMGLATLPIEKQDIVYVIQPEGYSFQLQDNSVPAFYRLVYQEASPAHMKYPGIQSLWNINDTLDFPMIASVIAADTFKVQMIGDIQAPTKKEVEFFQEMIVPKLLQHPADFKICLGDIADNYLDIYPAIEGALKTMETPTYMVFGNHDINYLSKDEKDQATTYRRHFGPEYYAFNVGKTHFVVLNTVRYKGWNEKENRNGSYTGGLDSGQLEWLKQDLALVPHDHQVVLMAHIPLMKQFADTSSIQKVFDLLKDRENLLAIYGHVHQTGSWTHNADFLWPYQGQFEGLIAGAACGGWWVGPYGLDSIPDATCSDGTPPGFYLTTFEAGKYRKSFIAAANSIDEQLRISAPPAAISPDSVQQHWIYVNVFDGNEATLVNYRLNNGPVVQMEKVMEIDPFLLRNNHLRYNRDQWRPGLAPSTHLWKAPLPEGLPAGKHLLQATCQLSDGSVFTTNKVFEVLQH